MGTVYPDGILNRNIPMLPYRRRLPKAFSRTMGWDERARDTTPVRPPYDLHTTLMTPVRPRSSMASCLLPKERLTPPAIVLLESMRGYHEGPDGGVNFHYLVIICSILRLR
jgi:hypothetical protein